jgi:hypothetical protein
MTNVLDSDELRKIKIDGLDLVLILSMLTLEIAAEISPSDAQGAVAAIANRVGTFAKGIPDKRMNLIFSQLSRSLIAAERTA